MTAPTIAKQYWFRGARILGCRHIEMSTAGSASCNSLLVWSCVSGETLHEN